MLHREQNFNLPRETKFPIPKSSTHQLGSSHAPPPHRQEAARDTDLDRANLKPTFFLFPTSFRRFPIRLPLPRAALLHVREALPMKSITLTYDDCGVTLVTFSCFSSSVLGFEMKCDLTLT